MSKIDIPSRIRYFRKDVLNESQISLGERVFADRDDMTQSAKRQRIKNFENGRKRPTRAEIGLLTKALGVSEEEFFADNVGVWGGSEVPQDSTEPPQDYLRLDIPKSFIDAHPEIYNALRMLGEAEKAGMSQKVKDAIIDDLQDFLTKKHSIDTE